MPDVFEDFIIACDRSLIENKDSSISDKISDLVRDACYHPFNLAIMDGSLEVENFKYFIAQDYYYLGDFAKSLKVISEKIYMNSDDFDLALKNILDVMADDVQAFEIGMQSSYFQKYDIDLSSVKRSDCSAKYGQFLIDTAERGEVSVSIAALAPCYMFYEAVGCHFLEEFTKECFSSSLRESFDIELYFDDWHYCHHDIMKFIYDNNPYAEWIETYTSPDFQKNVECMAYALEYYLCRGDEKSSNDMFASFEKSSCFEFEFWDDAYAYLAS